MSDDNNANPTNITLLDGVHLKPTWCDLLRPRYFDECLMHDSANDKLKALILDGKARDEFPHVMLTGPAGCGKRTRASCLLSGLYRITRAELRKIFELLPPKSSEHTATITNEDEESFEIRTRTVAPTLHEMLERINFVVKDGKEQRLSEEEQKSEKRTVPVNVVLTRARTITCDKAKDGIQVLHSPVHVEMTPHDVNFCDTKIVQSTLKDLFENNEFDLLTFSAAPSLSRFKRENDQLDDGGHSNPRFRIFIFNDVDKMSREAQTALRRIMEDYSQLARFILIAVNVDHVIAPIQSRCKVFQIPRPHDDEVRLVLESALVRVLPPSTFQRSGMTQALGPYLMKICEQSEGNVTKALTVLHASLHRLISNPDAMMNTLLRFNIAQPDWLQSMRECVRQICQVSMKSEQGGVRHVYLKETLGELLKRRVPTEYIVRYLDKHIRRTLREQSSLVLTSIEELLAESDTCDENEKLNREEQAFLQRKYSVIKKQLAGVCSDVSTACAFYETRSTKSQYSVIHVNALASCLICIVGLYQNSLSIALDADSKLRVCRPYSSVYDLGRLLRHTMQRAQKNNIQTFVLPESEHQTINAAKKMKQMCLDSNSLAGVDWVTVRNNAASETIQVGKILSVE